MVEPFERELIYYQIPGGKVPFRVWWNGFRDNVTKARIRTRINRLQEGQWGDFRSLGGSVYELRIHFGGGYRIYFGVHGFYIVLLTGGDKNSQEKNIWQAKGYWSEYLQRK